MSASHSRQMADLTIEADGESTRVASAWLARRASEFDVPAAQVDRLDICLNEILANIISHGDLSVVRPLVHVVLQIDHDTAGQGATVTITDSGAAFNATLAQLRPRPTSLADAEPGGLGLMMIRSFSDHQSYRYSDGKNHLSFGVRWGLADA